CQIALTVNGKTLTQPLTLKMDQRVKASAADLGEQFALSKELYHVRPQLEQIGRVFESLSRQLGELREGVDENSPLHQQLESFSKALAQFAPPNPRPFAPLTFDALAKLQSLF